MLMPFWHPLQKILVQLLEEIRQVLLEFLQLCFCVLQYLEYVLYERRNQRVLPWYSEMAILERVQ